MNTKYVIFGAGVHGSEAYEYLSEKVNIIGFSDNAPDKKNSKLKINKEKKEFLCMDPEHIPCDATVIIAVGKHHHKMIREQLSALHLNYITFDEWVFNENKDKLDTITQKYLVDDLSKEIFQNLISYRKSQKDYIDTKYVSDNQYFSLPVFRLNGVTPEVFVDAGAFVGDTIEKYIYYNMGSFHKIYAFEPGEKQYMALLKRTERLESEWALDKGKIICVKAALSDKVGNGIIQERDTLSGNYIRNEVPSGQYLDGREVSVVNLDSYINGRVDFIKADIEGAELKMLMGGQKIIQKYKPRLAISLYHKPQDFYELPEYIKTLVPEYQMWVRHYSRDWTETVLYCYAER